MILHCQALVITITIPSNWYKYRQKRKKKHKAKEKGEGGYLILVLFRSLLPFLFSMDIHFFFFVLVDVHQSFFFLFTSVTVVSTHPPVTRYLGSIVEYLKHDMSRSRNMPPHACCRCQLDRQIASRCFQVNLLLKSIHATPGKPGSSPFQTPCPCCYQFVQSHLQVRQTFRGKAPKFKVSQWVFLSWKMDISRLSRSVITSSFLPTWFEPA